MTTRIDVANTALVNMLGADRIDSFDDNQVEAIQVKTAWDLVRRSALEAREWSFNSRRSVLTATFFEPEFGFSYTVPVPSSALRVLQVQDPYYEDDPDVEYKVEGGNILCNTEQINVRYLIDVENVDEWSPAFADFMAYRLATRICIGITENRTLFADLYAQDRERLYQAAATDAQQHSKEKVNQGRLIRRR